MRVTPSLRALLGLALLVGGILFSVVGVRRLLETEAALPCGTTQLDATIPANTELLSLGAGRIRDLKQCLALDILGLPSATNVTAAPFSITAAGLVTISQNPLTFSTAATQIVPGATSISLRNNANNADNWILTDAGNATLRGSLTFSTAAAQIIPGATSISLRNNANNADNWIVTDAGNGTLRNNLVASGTGPHAIGGATAASVEFYIRGTTTNQTDPYGLLVGPTISTSSASSAGVVFSTVGGISTQAAVFTLADAIGALFQAPTLTIGAGSSITNGSTAKIQAAPTGATNNYALWGAAGAMRWDGPILLNTASPAPPNNQSSISIDGAGLLRLMGTTTGTRFVSNSGATELMRLTDGGILALGTSVTTGSGTGDLVIAYAKGFRSVNSAGNGSNFVIGYDTVAGLTNTLFLGGGGTSEVAFGHASRTAAAVASNFTADYYIKFRDTAGNLFYVPGRNATW